MYNALSVKEAMKVLEISSPMTFKNLVEEKQIPSVPMGSRMMLFPKAAFAQWMVDTGLETNLDNASKRIDSVVEPMRAEAARKPKKKRGRPPTKKDKPANE